LSHDNEFIPNLEDLPTADEPRGFKPAEMVTCDACLRANPPTRTTCIYCMVVLPVAAGETDLRKPSLRPLEEWEQGFNNVLVSGVGNELPEQSLQEIASWLRLEPEVLRLILERGDALPLARATTLVESSVISDRLQALGIKTVIVADADLKVETVPPKRIHALELRETSLHGREAVADAPPSISCDEISLIVTGRLLVNRVAVVENKFRGGERELVDSSEFTEDEPLVDIYSQTADEGWRIASRSFDFSCLGEKKKLLAAENFVTLVQTLRERAPAATFDDSYPQLRKLLTAVWPMVQQTSGGGWRRMRPGKFNVQAVTTTNNEAQFTRYSRLRHYLQLQGLQ